MILSDDAVVTYIRMLLKSQYGNALGDNKLTQSFNGPHASEIGNYWELGCLRLY